MSPKCIPGNETFLFPIEKPCPSITPHGLYIVMDQTVVCPGTVVNFTLNQLQVRMVNGLTITLTLASENVVAFSI